MRFPHLDMLDELLKFAEQHPAFEVSWYKSVAKIRLQAFNDLEPLMKPVPIPPVEELDA